MDEEDLALPKGSLLKQLSDEDLSVHSVDALNDRIRVLKSEVDRTESEINNKKDAHKDANSIFS
ncbi:MAG: DUF1192 family protein [Kordiimonadaceae bacterium]|jgi:uncharacterized small protein (DUF1192 family)|nr:DUF1192 family protein [Kordiimonadaceae bacterium]MBT6035148.1 DUF1192 family protein [Kordiimonadaceae bacterium]MBT6329823.1 DUF1192 family protein [Kordiimonadaceae bacterium]